MLKSAVLFLPCFVCLIWGLMLLCTKRKDKPRRVLTIMLLVSVVFFFADAFSVTPLDSYNDYLLLVRLDLLAQFSSLTLIPLLVIYIMVSQAKHPKWSLIYLSLVPALCQGVAASVVYAIIGFPEAASFIQAFDALGAFPPEYDHPIYHAHYTICSNSYNVLLTVEAMIGLLYLSVYTFRHRKQSLARVSMLFVALLLICILRLVLGREFLLANPGLTSVLTVLMTLLMFCIGYLATGLRPSDGPSAANRFPADEPETSGAVAPGRVTEEPEPASGADQAAPNYRVDASSAESTAPSKPHNLLESFVVYMVKEQPYLEPDFSVTDVCEALHTNRTYISELMAENFNMPFRDYVGILRISLAKKLLRNNPSRTLEDIAADSGFASSSQFVKKFKEITGTTPRAWLSMLR